MAKPLIERIFHGRSILEPLDGEARIGYHRFNPRVVRSSTKELRFGGIRNTTKGKYDPRTGITTYQYESARRHLSHGFLPSNEARKLIHDIGVKRIGVRVPKKLYAKIDNILYVDVAPNWHYAKINVRKEYVYDRSTNAMRRTRRTKVESAFYSGIRLNKYYLAKVFPKRDFNIAVRVGFIHPDAYHGSWVGRTIVSYRSLISQLLLNGYDPLLPLRDKKYLQKVAKEMGKACGEAIEKGRSFESVLRKFGRDMVDYVYQYIIGGLKPPLAHETITKRISLKKHGVFQYPRGVEEPLVETGEMAAEVSFEIITIAADKQDQDNDGEEEETEEEETQQRESKPIVQDTGMKYRGVSGYNSQAVALAARMAELQAQARLQGRGFP